MNRLDGLNEIHKSKVIKLKSQKLSLYEFLFVVTLKSMTCLCPPVGFFSH